MDLAERDTESERRAAASDEDLIRAFCSDPPDAQAGEELYGRCLQKIRAWTRKLVFGEGGYAPRDSDKQAFCDDAVSRASVYLVERVRRFRFEGPFDAWLAKLVKCAVLDERRKVTGRSKGESPKVESLDAMEQEAVTPAAFVFRSRYLRDPSAQVRDTEHRELVKTLLTLHAQSSNHGAESAGAIHLRVWGERTVKDIAEHRGTSERDVWRLLADDYQKLQQILGETFGLKTVRHV